MAGETKLLRLPAKESDFFPPMGKMTGAAVLRCGMGLRDSLGRLRLILVAPHAQFVFFGHQQVLVFGRVGRVTGEAIAFLDRNVS
jgi:hypothetical protein